MPSSAPSDDARADRRLLLVHAHPDDETIGTGVTMARYVAEGVHVTLVTCTRGEEGEVLVPELAALASSADDRLGEHREAELAAAMAVLGVTDHRFLGGPGRWRDSGMMGELTNERPDCFWQANLIEPATELVTIIREVRPQVLVTYDTFGGYGHPDHIQAHRVAMYGADLAAAPAYRPDLGSAWPIEKIYWTALPKSYVARGIDALIASGSSGFFGVESADELPFLTPDELVTTHIAGLEHEPVKMAALREHATQVSPEHGFFKMAELIGSDALGNEFFSLVRGRLGPDLDADGRESDLFSGVA